MFYVYILTQYSASALKLFVLSSFLKYFLYEFNVTLGPSPITKKSKNSKFKNIKWKLDKIYSQHILYQISELKNLAHDFQQKVKISKMIKFLL